MTTVPALHTQEYRRQERTSLCAWWFSDDTHTQTHTNILQIVLLIILFIRFLYLRTFRNILIFTSIQQDHQITATKVQFCYPQKHKKKKIHQLVFHTPQKKKTELTATRALDQLNELCYFALSSTKSPDRIRSLSPTQTFLAPVFLLFDCHRKRLCACPSNRFVPPLYVPIPFWSFSRDTYQRHLSI